MDHGFSRDQLAVISRDRDVQVTGLHTRTSNDIEYAAEPGTSPIAQLAGSVFGGDALSRIPNVAAGAPMYATYSDYPPVEGGSPEYTYTMGLETTGDGDVPDDMAMVRIAPGDFMTLPVPDPSPERIPAAWAWLLTYFDEADCPHQRAFAVDYEAYEKDDSGKPTSMTIGVSILGGSR